MADALTELTAAHDGIVTALGEVLVATADFHDGLGQASDPYTARRLRYLADEHLRVLRSDLTHTRDALADRHAPHPGRSTCTEEVPRHRTRTLRRVCLPAPRRARFRRRRPRSPPACAVDPHLAQGHHARP
ncbi:hypothetical protein [Streptomyces roseolus]|uniref:hypothetical protein n=1 Tax=Streptomyces roseolus TaxID=67358 RepID=UPI00364F8009